MIHELLRTIFPTFLILLIIYTFTVIITDVKKVVILKAFIVGVIVIIPAIITMKILGVLITIVIPWKLPILFFRILSSFNEETFKYLSIKRFRDKIHPIISSVFIGGGFALSETLFLSIGNNQMALLRSYTTLPLHILTAILLAKSMEKRRYFIYAIILHILYNYISSYY